MQQSPGDAPRTAAGEPRPAGPGHARLPAAAGFVAAGLVILAIGFIAGLLRRGAPDDVAPIRILAPASGDSVSAPLLLRFRTPAPLHLDPRQGWMAGDLHLHLVIDGQDVMPAAGDIAAVPGGAWTWQVRGLDAGTRRIFLTWAGRDHRAAAGDTDTIYIHVR